MPQDITVTFLGTSSGGGPTRTRNCSSLVVDMLGDGTLWMVDCAEGTTRQFELQPPAQYRARSGGVKTIFVTHMHADHTMGLVGFLKARLGIPKAGVKPVLKIELYGPTGLRAFIRTILNMTDSKCQDKYVVHEFLRPGEQPSAPCTTLTMRENEVKGQDIVCGEDGFWRECVRVWSNRAKRDIVVDVGQVVHRVPCLGFVIRESPMPSDIRDKDEEAQAAALGRLRKLVLLGDTNDPEGIIPLINSSPGHVALAVHEATECYIPTHVDPQQKTGKNRSAESVHAVSLQRGHSTSYMAGMFANKIGARRLVLNHLGARFPAHGRSGDKTDHFYVTGLQPEDEISGRSAPGRGENRDSQFRQNVMGWIERQATEAWAPAEEGTRTLAAYDFLTVCIKPVPAPVPPLLEIGEDEHRAQWIQTGQSSSPTNPGGSSGPGKGHGRYTGGPSASSNGVPQQWQRTDR